jgi:hypothetical protein
MPRLPASEERLARDLTVMRTYDEAADAARLVEPSPAASPSASSSRPSGIRERAQRKGSQWSANSPARARPPRS